MCILYILLVNIVHLSGTHQKRDPLRRKGFVEFSFYGLCSFLYIVYTTDISLQEVEEIMHKKSTFYAYVRHNKNSIYIKKYVIILLLFVLGYV